MKSISELKRESQEYLDYLWDEANKARDSHVSWASKVAAWHEDLEGKKVVIKKCKQGLDIKKESIITMNEISKFYETHSIRNEIENILQKVIGQMYNQSDMRYKFLKKYVKNQHEVSVWKIDKDKKGKEYLIPINDTSGGNRDIIDIIIRVLVIKQFDESQRILILDEPMKDLSKDLRECFFSFLKSLTDSFKIQFIMITHEDEYIGNVPWKLRFQKINTVTKITQVED